MAGGVKWREAADIGARVVASWGSRFLHLGRPVLDPKQSIWCIQLFVLNANDPPYEVGTIRIDAQTGEVLTRYAEVKAIFSKIQSRLGIKPFPKEQRERLSYLLTQNRAGKLDAHQQQELDELIEAADANETLPLSRFTFHNA